MDESAERIEAYESLLPIEHTLELRLKDIDDALEKLKIIVMGSVKNVIKRLNQSVLK